MTNYVESPHMTVSIYTYGDRPVFPICSYLSQVVITRKWSSENWTSRISTPAHRIANSYTQSLLLAHWVLRKTSGRHIFRNRLRRVTKFSSCTQRRLVVMSALLQTQQHLHQTTVSNWVSDSWCTGWGWLENRCCSLWFSFHYNVLSTSPVAAILGKSSLILSVGTPHTCKCDCDFYVIILN